MLRVLIGVFLSCFWVGGAVAQSLDLNKAMEAVRGKDWNAAAAYAQDAGGAAPDIVEWHRLRAAKGTPEEVLDFLERNPDWPGIAYLRKQSEKAFSASGTNREIATFFKLDAPQSAEGALAFARQLAFDGEDGMAQAEIVLAWRSMVMAEDTMAAYLSEYGDLLKPHHEARLDYLLWQGESKNAQRMYPLVSADWKKLAEARIGLRKRVNGVDALIAAVPASLKSDPGLAFERFNWRARKGRNEAAIELLLAQSKADALGEPVKWASWRRKLARVEMRAGRHSQAYLIASQHGLTDEAGYAYSDLEWISGYLALRFLDAPDAALGHFIRFEKSVETPISLGRAGYWIGRSLEDMDDPTGALKAFQAGGAHQTSFYGLLAAERAGMPADVALRGKERFPDWRDADFTKTSVHVAAAMLYQAGETSLAERFWVHLAESQDRVGLGQMGQMAQDIGAPHIAVMLGKRMVRQGVTLPGPYYPLHELVDEKLPVAPELALAIARRESEFDPVVVSHAGARGLMQLMPGTAQQVAGELGLGYSKSKLTSDPTYNAKLGSQYLADLAEEFNGNVIMMAAGYNAGPSRPISWMARNGDPRQGEIDIVDWIEHIPFDETRNYVMRVSESLPVYRARLGKEILPIPFSRELIGSTLNPLTP